MSGDGPAGRSPDAGPVVTGAGSRPVGSRRLIVTADDFGLSEGINEAVERAHREGVLSTASLMVAGPAAADAVRRARALPGLRVGLHLVVVEGAAMQPRALPGLVDAEGAFPSKQLRLSVDYFFRPARRGQLRAEIEAQFAAFAATGLRLDHANAHKHMQLHPTVGRICIEVGRGFGLPAMRVPREPPGALACAGTRVGVGGRAMAAWSALLRRQARAAGLRVNDAAFGIAWSGHMTSARLLRLLPHLPPGLNEVYLHPAARRDGRLAALMPGYEHEAELATLLDPAVRAAMDASGIVRTTYDAG